MWNVQVTGLLAGTVAALALTACAGSPKAEMPAGVTLAGDWRLNHTASDDPQVVIGKMRERAQKILLRQAIAQGDTPGPRGGTQGPEMNSPLGGDDSTHGMRRPDPLRYSPMMRLLTEVVARGDYLTVHQSADQFMVDYGTTRRSYTPGARSVVSSGSGVADQTSGWDGRSYLINLKAQLGPNVVESYALSADGTHLINKVHIGPAELPAVELTRVYDRNTGTAPRAPPTTE